MGVVKISEANLVVSPFEDSSLSVIFRFLCLHFIPDFGTCYYNLFELFCTSVRKRDIKNK